jgi:tetratricopeptide (TPR) repeat protein
MDQLVVLQEIFESYMRGGFSRPIDPKSISGDCANQVAALLESFEEGQIDENICHELLNCLSDIYDIKRLGDICRLAGHLGTAARCYNKALSLASDQHLGYVLLNNLGQVHARQGYLGRALHYYERAAEGFSALGDVGSLAHVLGNMASAYRSGQDYDKALESCRKSLDLFKELDDEFGVAQMTGSLGRIYAETGDFDLALQRYEKSLAEFEGLGDQRQVAWLLNRMGRVKADMGDGDAAIGYYHRSMEIFEAIGQNHNAGVVLSNLGRLYLDRGDYDLAADHLETSLDLINKSMQPVRANATSLLSFVRRVQGQDQHLQALQQITGGQDAEETFTEASNSYAESSDCLHELARTPGLGHPDLEVEAGIAELASAFVIMEMVDDPERAIMLAEEGVGALNSALSKADDDSVRPSVEALRRSMMGMKEAWRITLIRDEPWKLFDVVSDATEHFSQAILQLGSYSRGCQEACGHLLPAFKTLGKFMTAELKGEPPTDLAETMAYLKRAESSFELAAPELGTINPFQIREARMMAARLEEISRSGPESRLLLETYQGTLHLMGRVLTRSVLTEASRLEVVRTWNESMAMVEEVPGGSKPRRNDEILPAFLKEDESLYARELIQEYEEFREKRAKSRSPVIRPVEEVLSIRDGPQIEVSEALDRSADLIGTPEPEPIVEVETKPATPVENPVPTEFGTDDAGDHPMAERCEEFAFVEGHHRPLLRSASRFVSGFVENLDDLAPGRTEFKTPRLQRSSHKVVIQHFVLRGFRFFLALVFLYMIVDLTHYFI